jgi:hypothetical protein
MKKNVIVREYVDDDFESLIELYKNSLTYGGQYDEARDTRDKLLATAEDLCLFVAAADNEVIGSVMILDNPHSFWLQRFCISTDITEESQNDIAILLLDTTERIAQSRGHKSIIVYTNPDNEDLVARYEQLSFAKAGQYSCFWKPVQPKGMGL